MVTAGARPAQNSREVIQFGVGSKLCGHMRTAQCGDGHRASVDASLCLAVLLTGHRKSRAGVPGGSRESERETEEWDLT